MNTVLSVLQHALGRDEYGQRRRGRDDDYRNHFCAGGDDLPICREAAAQGLMVELQSRNAALIAEAEAVVAALAAFDPFAVVVVDRTGAK